MAAWARLCGGTHSTQRKKQSKQAPFCSAVSSATPQAPARRRRRRKYHVVLATAAAAVGTQQRCQRPLQEAKLHAGGEGGEVRGARGGEVFVDHQGLPRAVGQPRHEGGQVPVRPGHGAQLARAARAARGTRCRCGVPDLARSRRHCLVPRLGACGTRAAGPAADASVAAAPGAGACTVGSGGGLGTPHGAKPRPRGRRWLGDWAVFALKINIPVVIVVVVVVVVVVVGDVIVLGKLITTTTTAAVVFRFVAVAAAAVLVASRPKVRGAATPQRSWG